MLPTRHLSPLMGASALGLIGLASVTRASPPPVPDPLTFADGRPVTDAGDWPERRHEILELFRGYVYGRSPAPPAGSRSEVREESRGALGGRADRKQVRIHLSEEPPVFLDLLLYTPAQATAPVPAFLALNFRGNHTVHSDPAILLPESWVPEDEALGVRDHRAGVAGRGGSSSRWAVETILERGYALATVYYGDIDPDYDDGFRNGVHALGFAGENLPPAEERWGSIAAWAWGLSRALDHLEHEPAVDATRVAVMGHSRLGKAALWAGAQDERFALVISNDSGCGGAALSRRRVGETVAKINERFPHWFSDSFTRFDDREETLPVDQHLLLALVAPRPLYVASATEDEWADPEGEFLASVQAGPVYRLLDRRDLGVDEMPAPDSPVRGGDVGYHIRTGRHDVTAFDWEAYLDFADRHLGGGS
jgi:hypothetical protein